MMEFESLRPEGEHGDKPGPRLRISIEDRGTVAFEIVKPNDDGSRLVEVPIASILAAMHALAAHENAQQAKYDRFMLHHRRECAECGDRSPAVDGRK